jgi:hypothetical protein
VDEGDATPCCRIGKQRCSSAINGKRAFWFRFSPIDRCIGRRIDNCRRFDRGQHAIDPLPVFKIQFGPADRYHRHVAQDGRVTKTPSQLTALARNEDRSFCHF